MKAIAIDDEPPALRVIHNFCEQIDSIELVKTFTNPHEAINYLDRFPVDLLFLDIHMPSVSGIDLLQKIDQKCLVIFTTAHSRYAVEGFNLQAIDYLLKPFTFTRFKQAVEKALEMFIIKQNSVVSKQTCFYVRADYNLVKVNHNDIAFIEGMDDYIKINLFSQKPLTIRMTMKAIAEKLPQNDFIRIHRSYILPVASIVKYSKKEIFTDIRSFPIGNSYQKHIFGILNPDLKC